jgi:hypothetical protein
MLHALSKILYNKLPEIAEEWALCMGRESTAVGTEEQSRLPVTANAIHDVEACKGGKPKPGNSQSTPTRRFAKICRVATVESPDSQDDHVEIVFHEEYYNDDYDSSIRHEYPFASRHIQQGERSFASPNKCETVADGSVYLDSYNGDADHQSVTGTMPSSYSPELELAKKSKIAPGGGDLNSVSTSYSLDIDKESFSSYARPSYSHITSHIMDDTTICPDTNHPNSFSFLKDNLNFVKGATARPGKSIVSVVSLSSCSGELEESTEHTPATQSKEVSIPVPTETSEETRKTLASSHSAGLRLEDSSSIVASRESFSPLERRNVTFSSALLDETSFEESPKPMDRHGMSLIHQRDMNIRRKPEISIITNRSLRNLDEVHETDCRSNEAPDTEKGITPLTEATTGTWESEASMSPHPSEEDVEISFSSAGDSLSSNEADIDNSREEEKAYSCQKVHLCKSASCTSCRNPTQNSPIFVSVSTGQQLQLQRHLPKRWWDTQESNFGQLKHYVSSVLLSTSTTMASQYCSAVNCMEEHPFDET